MDIGSAFRHLSKANSTMTSHLCYTKAVPTRQDKSGSSSFNSRTPFNTSLYRSLFQKNIFRSPKIAMFHRYEINPSIKDTQSVMHPDIKVSSSAVDISSRVNAKRSCLDKKLLVNLQERLVINRERSFHLSFIDQTPVNSGFAGICSQNSKSEFVSKIQGLCQRVQHCGLSERCSLNGKELPLYWYRFGHGNFAKEEFKFLQSSCNSKGLKRPQFYAEDYSEMEHSGSGLSKSINSFIGSFPSVDSMDMETDVMKPDSLVLTHHGERCKRDVEKLFKASAQLTPSPTAKSKKAKKKRYSPCKAESTSMAMEYDILQDLFGDLTLQSPHADDCSNVKSHTEPFVAIPPNTKKENGKAHFAIHPNAQFLIEKLAKQRKKCRPSSQKRRRHRSNRCEDSTSRDHFSQVHIDKKRKTNQGSSLDSTKLVPSQNELPCNDSYSVVIGFSSQHRDTKEASSIPTPSGSASSFSFVLNGSDSSEDLSEDEDSDLYDDDDWSTDSHFNIQEDCSVSLMGGSFPFSLQITCYTSKDENKETPAAEKCTGIHHENELLLTEVNSKWNVMYAAAKSDQEKESKVHFAQEPGLTQIYHLTEWAEESRESRKGPWEQYARDHARFQHRIKNIEAAISSCLSAQHRESIFLRIHGAETSTIQREKCIV